MKFKPQCGNSKIPYGTVCVRSRYKIYALKVKHKQYVYAVWQLPTFIGLCPDERISIDLIQGYN